MFVSSYLTHHVPLPAALSTQDMLMMSKLKYPNVDLFQCHIKDRNAFKILSARSKCFNFDLEILIATFSSLQIPSVMLWVLGNVQCVIWGYALL